MKKGYLWLPLVLLLAFSVQSVNAVMMDFEDLDANDFPYSVGESFWSAGVEITVEEMEPLPASLVLPTGYVDVVVPPGFVVPGAGNELKISSSLLNFAFDGVGCQTRVIALFFAEYGGTINLGINSLDEILTGEDFDDLNGQTINGAMISVLQTDTQGAMMVVDGEISSFFIGGEEVYIDNVFVCEIIPEPTTIALLGFGGLTLLMNRKKS